MATWKLELTRTGRLLEACWWLGPVAVWIAGALPADWTVKELRRMTDEEQRQSDARRSLRSDLMKKERDDE